jgi:hypothetical protein
MLKKYLLICIATLTAISACSSKRVQPILEQKSEFTKIISGKIIDIHMLGTTNDSVFVCHFDPQFVVSIQTDEGIDKIAIHSPAQLLLGEESVGKYYRFYLSKSDNQFMLNKIEEIKP